MKINLKRHTFTETSTLGDLFLNEQWFCYTLEDPEQEVKIPGQTCIPAGKYKVSLNHSPRFKRLMPQVLDVPGFEGIRIHWGNMAGDTEGCILVGYTKGINFIGQSKKAFNDLMGNLTKALTAPIELTIERTT